MRNVRRHYILTAAVLSCMVSCGTQAELAYSVAHRGGHVDGLVPENSVAGVFMAKRYGFRAFECDVHYTKDSVMVLMHDATINRTMRNASDYSEIKEETKYAALDYSTLRTGYVLASEDESLRTPLPDFDEILEACRQTGMIPMLHTNLPEAYRKAHEVLGDRFIAFDTDYEALKEARKCSSCLILWDPGKATAEEAVEKLKALGGRCGISSMNYRMLDREYDRTIREAGFEVQESIFPCPHELQGEADASIVLSDFSLFPTKKKRPMDVLKIKDEELGRSDGHQLLCKKKTPEYGSLTLDIRFSGKLKVTVNDRWTYVIEGDGIRRYGGWRFHGEAPKVDIEALEDSRVDGAIMKCYEY